MSECKHGLKSGCAYCHAFVTPMQSTRTPKKRGGRSTRLSEQMNDRMTDLKQRLKKLRDQQAGHERPVD